MHSKFLFNLLVFVWFTGITFAQEKDNTKPTYTGTVTSMTHVPSIASRTDLLPSRTKEIQMMDGRAPKTSLFLTKIRKQRMIFLLKIRIL